MDRLIRIFEAAGRVRGSLPGTQAVRALLGGSAIQPEHREALLSALVERIREDLDARVAILTCETSGRDTGGVAPALAVACLQNGVGGSFGEARPRLEALLAWAPLRDDLEACRTHVVADFDRARGPAGPWGQSGKVLALLGAPWRPPGAAVGGVVVLRSPASLDPARMRLEEIAAIATPIVQAAFDPEVLPLDAEIARFLAFLAGREPWQRPAGFTPDPDLCGRIGLEVLSRNGVLPLGVDDRGALRIAVLDPFDQLAIDDVIIVSGCEVGDIQVGAASEIRGLLDDVGNSPNSPTFAATPEKEDLPSLADLFDDLAEGDAEPGEDPAPEGPTDPALPADHPARLAWEKFLQESAGAGDDAESAPVIRFVEEMLRAATVQRADEVHVDPTGPLIRVRFRVDGALRTHVEVPRSVHGSLTARLKILGNLDISERRRPQSGELRWKMPERSVRARLATLPTLEGERLCLTLWGGGAGPQSLEEIFPEAAVRARLSGILARGRGLVLFAGPGQSGRTTLAYACLRHLVAAERAVLSAEWSVEAPLSGVSQVSVQPDVGLDFPSALRAMLSQSPDAVYVSDLAGHEMGSAVVSAARERCLALATIHAADTGSSLTRLLDMGVEPYLLGEALAGAVAVRLVRALCGCAVSREARAEERALLGSAGAVMLRFPRGCPECRGTGYRGRVGVQEVLVADDPMRIAIGAGQDREGLRARAIAGGMRSLWDDAAAKVRAGITSLSEALALGVR